METSQCPCPARLPQKRKPGRRQAAVQKSKRRRDEDVSKRHTVKVNRESRGTMARAPWGARRRSFPDALRRPETPGIDRVALYLEVQRLIVHAKKASRLTLVATRSMERQTDCLPLGLDGNTLDELLQRERRLNRPFDVSSCHAAQVRNSRAKSVLRLDYALPEPYGRGR